MTDVWTSAGVLVGVLLVAVTGWERLEPREDPRAYDDYAYDGHDN
jgi:hypothetical protein